MTNVTAVAPTAIIPTGTSRRLRPMPSALMAINSLSVESRPSAMSTPTRTPMGMVRLKMSGKVEMNRMAMADQDPGWRTSRSISFTSCGTKNTNVNMPNPRKAWEKIWRQMYRSIRRIARRPHSSTPEAGNCSQPLWKMFLAAKFAETFADIVEPRVAAK